MPNACRAARRCWAVALALLVTGLAPCFLALAQPGPEALTFDVDLFLWELGVSGPPDEAVTVYLSAPDGRRLASGEGNLDGQGRALVQLFSPAGDHVIPRSGDWITATSASALGELELPPLEVGADLAVGDIFGKTTPEMSLTLRYDGYRWSNSRTTIATGTRWTRESDKSGRFSFGLGSVMTLRNFELFRLFLQVDRHIVSRYVPTISLSVNQDRRRLIGRLEPFVDYRAEVKRGETVVATGTERTAYEGAIGLPLTDTGGSPLVVLPGDVVSIKGTAGLGTRETALTVPELGLDLAEDGPTASGQAPPDGEVLLQWQGSALGPQVAGAGVQLRPTRETDGRFKVTWPGLAAFGPGSQIHFIYMFPDGNFVDFTRALALVKVEDGGSLACGSGNAFDPVDLRLADGAGQPLASAGGQVGELAGQRSGSPYTSFVTRFRAADGMTTALQSGQVLSARIGASQLSAPVGRLTVAPDWAGRRVEARYEPAGGGVPTAMRLHDVAGTCLVDRTATGGAVSTPMDLAHSADSYTGSLRAYAPGQGFTIVATDPSGLRVSRQARRAQAQIYVGTDRVGGLASPQAWVTLTLQPAAGPTLGASAQAEMDSGAFDVRFARPSGATVIRPGDQLRLVSAEESQTVTVEPLDAHFSADFGVYGHAPVGRALRVSLFTELGETVFDAQTDAEGGFSLLPWDLMPRLRRNMEDVSLMRVVLPTPGGHEIVVEAAPTKIDRRRAYLPMLAANARR